MALESTQPLTKMSTSNISCSVKTAGALPPSRADCLEIREPQTPGTLRVCPDLYRDCCTSACIFMYVHLLLSLTNFLQWCCLSLRYIFFFFCEALCHTVCPSYVFEHVTNLSKKLLKWLSDEVKFVVELKNSKEEMVPLWPQIRRIARNYLFIYLFISLINTL